MAILISSKEVVFNKDSITGMPQSSNTSIININTTDTQLINVSIPPQNKLNGFVWTITETAGPTLSGTSLYQIGVLPGHTNRNTLLINISFNPSRNQFPLARVKDFIDIIYTEQSTGKQGVERIHLTGNNEIISQNDLQILYINSNPRGNDAPGSDREGEVISIKNNTNRVIDLMGCSIRHNIIESDGSIRVGNFYTFSKPCVLEPFGFNHKLCAVYTGGNPLNDDNASTIRQAGLKHAIWNNTGDTAKLIGLLGMQNVIDEASYGKNQFFFSGMAIDINQPAPGGRGPGRGSKKKTVDVKWTVPEDQSVSWDGTGNWQATGLFVESGDSMEFAAEGRFWSGYMTQLFNLNDPDGLNIPPFDVALTSSDGSWPYNGSADAFKYCLIGKVGINGDPFFIGKSTVLTSNVAGNQEIFVGINDERPFRAGGVIKPLLPGWSTFRCTITIT